MVITTPVNSASASLSVADTITTGTATANETTFELPAELPGKVPATTDTEGRDDKGAQPAVTLESASQPGALNDLVSSTTDLADKSAGPTTWQSAQMTSQQFTPLQLSIEQTLNDTTTATDCTSPLTTLSVDADATGSMPEVSTPLLPAQTKKAAADHTTAALSNPDTDAPTSDFTPWQINATPATPLAETPQTLLTTNTAATNSDNTSAEPLTIVITTTAPPTIGATTETCDLAGDAPWLVSANTMSSAAAEPTMTRTEQWSGAQNISSHNASEQHELNQLLASVLIHATGQNQITTSVANTSHGSTATASTSAQQLGEQLLDTLKQQVSLQLTQQSQQATIRLDPPHLGQLEIAIRLDGDKLTVQINAEHAAVRESLQSSREQLRQLLIPSHGSSVDVDISQEQPSTSQQRQQTYALWQEPDILSAATVTTAQAATLSSAPVTTGDWLNTVV
jgi:flagellar hook-length control protein FliK